MTDIGFYHLTRSPLERALPKLLEKVQDSGACAVVMAGSEERVAALNNMLWTYDSASFLAHGCAEDGNAPDQPIWLTTEDQNPNGASILVLTDGATSGLVETYQRCLEMFDGQDPDAVAAARKRWTSHKDSGHSLTYWQENERGGWEKKDG